VLGCTNDQALNYDSLANTNDGSCITIVEGCMDYTAFNFDPFANVENNSCIYDGGCVGEPGEPYWLNDDCYAWVIVVDPYCCTNDWDKVCQEQYNYCDGERSLDIEDLTDNGSIVIYPNPSTDVINIASIYDLTISVYNMLGEKLITTQSNRIDISSLPDGVYNIKMEYDNLVINRKVIKQK
jgi:hypothetical protein